VGETHTFEAAWTPEAPGIYSTQTFVWESWETPQPLSRTFISEIKVDDYPSTAMDIIVEYPFP